MGCKYRYRAFAKFQPRRSRTNTERQYPLGVQRSGHEQLSPGCSQQVGRPTPLKPRGFGLPSHIPTPPLGLPPPQRSADLRIGAHTTPLQYSCSFLAPISDACTLSWNKMRREREGAAYERPQRCRRAHWKWPPSITEFVLVHFICPAEHSAGCPLCTRSGLRAPLKSFLHTSCVRLSTQTGALAHNGSGLRVPLSVSGTLQEPGCALQESRMRPKNLRYGV